MRNKRKMNNQFATHICGLHYTIGSGLWDLMRTYLPQVRLKSHTTISPVSFTTQLTQTFHNPNSEALPQVRYTFPLYDGVAVNGYTIKYASKVLKGVVKQKDVANTTYQAAVDRGEAAGLLESLPAAVFGVTLGNVPANTDIVVEIFYCGELRHDAAIDGLRYMLPTSIAPRYGSYPGQVLNSNTIATQGISITVDLDMANSAIRKVQSPSHPIAVSMGATSTTEEANQAPFMPSQASAALALGTTELADDFVLQLLIDDISKPQAILETHPTLPNHRAIMATMVPKFTLEPAHPEIVFIADQSGSMSGTKNAALVSALKVFLKSLPFGVRFNICAFGNQFRFLWPKSQAYSEDNINTAISFVDSFNASYGGTQILEPITAAFEQRLSDLPLEVMLLTDGEIWAETALFDYINKQVHEKRADARVFALGIGGDVSHTLIEGVARAGNGFAQFVTQNEEIDQKVVRMLKGALHAHTKDYELEVHYDQYDEKAGAEMSDEDEFEIVEKVNDCLRIADEPADIEKKKQGESSTQKMSFFDTSAKLDEPMEAGGEAADRYAHLPAIETPKLLQAPNAIPPLFPFNRTTIYLLLGPDSAPSKVTSVTLRASSSQGPLELNIPVQYSNSAGVSTIHQLAAIKSIQDLEEGRGWVQSATTAHGASVKTKYESRFDEIIERESVRLGEKFQVAGKWTSFIAVEDKSNEDMNVDGQEVEAEEAPRQAPRGHDTARTYPSIHKNMAAGVFGGVTCQGYVPPSASLFSNSGEGTSLFGHPRSQPSQPQNVFGTPANPPTSYSSASRNVSGGLFGSSQHSSTPPGGGLGSSSNSRNVSGGLFGNAQSSSTPSGGGLGSSSNSTNGSGSLFGVFDRRVSAAQGSPTLLGSSTGSPTSTLQSSSFAGFGSQPHSSGGSASLFGASRSNATSALGLKTSNDTQLPSFGAQSQSQGFGSDSLTSSPRMSYPCPVNAHSPFSNCSAGVSAPQLSPDYQNQLLLLEQQNNKRSLMRQQSPHPMQSCQPQYQMPQQSPMMGMLQAQQMPMQSAAAMLLPSDSAEDAATDMQPLS